MSDLHTHEETLFTSDTSSGRELPMQGVSIVAAPWPAPETPPLIKSVEDELPAYREGLSFSPSVYAAIPQSSINAARITALEADLAAAVMHGSRQEADLDAEIAKVAALEGENGKLREIIETMRRSAERGEAEVAGLKKVIASQRDGIDTLCANATKIEQEYIELASEIWGCPHSEMNDGTTHAESLKEVRRMNYRIAQNGSYDLPVPVEVLE